LLKHQLEECRVAIMNPHREAERLGMTGRTPTHRHFAADSPAHHRA
jgi:hypothetical protein